MLATMNLEQLTSALSMQCADIKGVASSPGQFEGNPAASLQLLRACNRYLTNPVLILQKQYFKFCLF